MLQNFQILAKKKKKNHAWLGIGQIAAINGIEDFG